MPSPPPPPSPRFSSSSTSKAQQARKRARREDSNPHRESSAHKRLDASDTTWQEQSRSRRLPQHLLQRQDQDQPQLPFSQLNPTASISALAEQQLSPLPPSLSISPTAEAFFSATPTLRYPPQRQTVVAQPTFTLPESDDEDATWLVIIVLTTVLIIMIATVIRSCSQKANWLSGSSPPSAGGRQGHGSGSGRGGGRGGRGRGYGPHRIPEWEVDPDATEEQLAALSDADRQAYEAAQAFQIVHPANSFVTDISLSQYLSIQEKGVSAWEFEASYDQQLFVHDRTELSFFDQVACVQTNLPLPKQQEVYYWEVKIFEKSPSTIVSVGVATKPYPTTRLPGWNRHSAGYFSHNGQKYCNSLWSGYPYGPIYFEGDVVGCGYRPRNGTIFFTRNGRRIEEAYTGFGRMNLFPTVGATGPCVLHVNFGQFGFVFVEANVKKWGLAPASGSLAPPPAYGSELGSILLEVAGSGANVQSPPSSSRRPILQSNSSRTQVQVAGALRREDSSRGVGNLGGGGGGGNGGAVAASSPVQISLANMSAPPPNYSSLDRFGRRREQDIDAGSVASTDSDESATLLLGDARWDPDSDVVEEEDVQHS